MDNPFGDNLFEQFMIYDQFFATDYTIAGGLLQLPDSGLPVDTLAHDHEHLETVIFIDDANLPVGSACTTTNPKV